MVPALGGVWNSDVDLQGDDLEGIAPRRRHDTPFAAGAFPDDGRRLEDSAGGALDPDRLLEDREGRPVGQGAVGEVGEEEGEVFRLDRAKDPDAKQDGRHLFRRVAFRLGDGDIKDLAGDPELVHPVTRPDGQWSSS